MKISLRPAQARSIQRQLNNAIHYWENFVQAGLQLPGDNFKRLGMEKTAASFSKAVRQAKTKGKK